MALSATCVSGIYQGVIEDVIAGVREVFLDEGVDEQVLTDLKQTWESKLQATKVTDHKEPQTSSSSQPQQSSGTQSSTTTTYSLVPVQITVPAQQAGGVPKTITVHVPGTALANGVAGQQLQTILGSPAAAQTFSLEIPKAAEVIQRQLNAALQNQGIELPPQLLQYSSNSSQVDGPCDSPIGSDHMCPPPPSKSDGLSTLHNLLSCSGAKPKDYKHLREPEVMVDKQILDRIMINRLRETQVDGSFGLGDSSDEISDDDDDDDDDKDEDEDKKGLDDDEEEEEGEGAEEEPLNSEDDVSDEEEGDMFETDNVVVCQYEKVTRVRAKWKFSLKDGIMNLKGKDYVFHKATGEGEW
ncbi:transcription factor IIA L [Oratosquilla oratoria]|uniref:transcription factor IIA L n=1 Tax=Oratosquilla oratoria TaxID=337810 RepID=UPI003F7617C4